MARISYRVETLSKSSDATDEDHRDNSISWNIQSDATSIVTTATLMQIFVEDSVQTSWIQINARRLSIR